ncbi:MAG: tyrosine-type recombinase/integrase [Proteobacteria bacterium]|nr:tyrosine-type recombinase/integrase [Pseudomonadota bacterium]
MEVNSVLIKSFEKWLKTLGYAESTVYASIIFIRDFFKWLKLQEIEKLNQITKPTIKAYHNYLQTRKNKRQTGSLSQNYITSNINALKRFSKYLNETGKAFLEIDIQPKQATEETKIILTKDEIQKLYKACGNNLLGIRDRAMLNIYYGCGLRRSEGINLNLSDVLLKEKLVHVRQGKGYKERYVPITESIKEELENYIYVAREQLQSYKPEKQEVYLASRQALFLSMRAKRIHGNSIILRLQKLAIVAQINKEIGLHTLRHSIATHLLQSGMTLEEVSQFLGHGSLESTQIYTHLANEI